MYNFDDTKPSIYPKPGRLFRLNETVDDDLQKGTILLLFGYVVEGKSLVCGRFLTKECTEELFHVEFFTTGWDLFNEPLLQDAKP